MSAAAANGSRVGFVANVHNTIPTLSAAMIKALRDPKCYGMPATREALHERGLITWSRLNRADTSKNYVIWLRTVFGFRTLEAMFPDEFWEGAVGVHRDEIFNRVCSQENGGQT